MKGYVNEYWCELCMTVVSGCAVFLLMPDSHWLAAYFAAIFGFYLSTCFYAPLLASLHRVARRALDLLEAKK